MVFAKKFRLSAVVVLIGGLLLSANVAAEPGDGLRSENGWTLVPSLTLGAAYTSNLFRTSVQEDRPIVRAPKGSVAPALSLANDEDRNFRLRMDGGVQWEEYFESLASADDFNRRGVGNQSGLSAHANGQATLNAQGDVSLELADRFSRHNEPPINSASQPYNWWKNQAGATVGIHPGGGVLNADLGYTWTRLDYTTSALDDLDRHEHNFDFDGEWKFLPKTSFLARAGYQLTRWDEDVRRPARDDIGGELANVDSNPLRLMGGLDGLLTNRIALRALAGYGWSMHDSGPSFEGVIGEAGIVFTPGDLKSENSLEFGYRRNFSDASVGNYYTSHEVFAEYDQGLMDRMLSFYLGADFQLRDYSLNLELEDDPDSGISLRDEILVGRAGVRADPTKWLTFDLSYNLQANFSGNQYEIDAVDPTEPDVAVLREYTQHLVTLSTTLRY